MILILRLHAFNFENERYFRQMKRGPFRFHQRPGIKKPLQLSQIDGAFDENQDLPRFQNFISPCV